MTRPYCQAPDACVAGRRGTCGRCQPRKALARAKIAAEYLSGLSLREVAARNGVTFQRVHQVLIDEGVAMRPRGHQRPAGAI